MKPAELTKTCGYLIENVLAPLVGGGVIVPFDSIEAKDAQAIVNGVMQIYGGPTASYVDEIRAVTARRIMPLDVPPPLSAATWTMLLALNNLLRATDPETLSHLLPFGIDFKDLVHNASTIVDRVPPVASVTEAVERHSVFANVLRIRRTNKTVSWWCGSESFPGREPPERILSWPDLRHVHVTENSSELLRFVAETLTDMPSLRMWSDAFRKLLQATPLTDLQGFSRPTIGFALSESSVRTLSDPRGRVVALRVLRRTNPHVAADALEQSLQAYEQAMRQAYPAARSAVLELRQM